MSISAPTRSPVGLRQGARIVLTGRVADASLTLGPAVAHFGWGWDDWPRLAGASTAGHLIECGAQATGGLWSGWAELPDLAGIGYPIAEIADGRFVRDHQAAGDGRAGERRDRHRAVALRDRRPRALPDAGRGRRFHRPLDGGGGDRPGRRSAGAAGGPPPIGSSWWASIATAGRRAACWRWWDGTRRPRRGRPGEVILERVRRAGYSLADTLVECLGRGDVAPRRGPAGSRRRTRSCCG